MPSQKETALAERAKGREMELGKHQSMRRPETDNFHVDGKPLKQNLLSFWQWSSSEILGNALRGVLAEYIVSLAVGCTPDIREEWGNYDLLTPDGFTVEVKSAGYLQAWAQKSVSLISFGIPPTCGWDASTNIRSGERKRQAEVYVFCVLAHKDKTSVDPLNLIH